MFCDEMIVERVPKWVRNRTRENMDKHFMGLYDAFQEAVRAYSRPSVKLSLAFYYDDFREYIPSEYLPEYLDFKEHPLKYVI